MRLEKFRGLYVDLRAIPWTAKDRERAKIKRNCRNDSLLGEV